MRIDIFTIFPEPVSEMARLSVLGRAADSGAVDLRAHDVDIMTMGQYLAARAEEARLLAEQQGEAVISFSPELLESEDGRAIDSMAAMPTFFSFFSLVFPLLFPSQKHAILPLCTKLKIIILTSKLFNKY